MNIPYLFTKQQLTVRLFAALTIVSLLLTAFPAAFFVAEAATSIYGPQSETIETTDGFESGAIVASGHTNLNLAFNYDSTKLDGTDDSFSYGWRSVGGSNNQLGVINGLVNETVAEISSISVALPAGAQIANLEIYISVAANSGGASDEVVLTDVVVLGDAVPVVCAPQFNVAGPTSVKNTTTNEFFNSVNDALADCDTVNGNTVELLGNISIGQQITINKSITLDGNNFTISPTFTRTDNSNNSSIAIIDTNNVTIKELKIDGTAGTNLHGINIYQSTGVNINDTSITNPKRTGVVVNGSNVTVNNLTTSGSTWHAINAAPGTGVTAPTVLTVNGVSVHGEAAPTPHIFTDDTSKNVTVNDTNSQYEVVFEGALNPAKPTLISKSWRLKAVPTTVKVRIYKYLQTGQVIAQVPDNATAPSFPMNAVWNATNIGAGSGNYVLGNTHGGAAFRYAADTSPMSVPADYTTTEITGGDSPVLPIGAECSEDKYRLVGYKQGDSVALAEAAALTSAAPVYTDITTDKYIIVVNEKCAAAPKPICAIGENLIQNGSFETTPAVTANSGQWQIFSSISSWMVSLSDGLEVWKNFNGTGAGLASDGIQNVELDGNDATKISQSIATVPGATYELKFDYSARAATAVADSKMDAMVDGVSVLSLNTDGSAATANVWEPKTKNFVATGAATVVSFEDKGVANADGGYGPLLDNVAVCLVSIPRCEIAMTSSTNTVIDSTNYAVETYNNHPSWTASIPGAKWVWSTFYVNDANVDETRVFTETFTVNGASSALLDISADNSYKVFVNGTLVLDRSAIENNFMSFAQKNDVDIKSFLVNGSNELKIEVKNLAQPGGSKLTNPAGVLYRLDIVGQSSCEVTTKVKAPVVVDVCPNLPDTQSVIPEGYEKVGDSVNCTEKAVVLVDVCLNIPNTQTTVPEGFTKANENSDCIAIQTTVVETNDSGGGNGGGNRNSARSARAPQGQVLGASTLQCGMYLLDYTKEGIKNDEWEVKKLQWFLVGQGYAVPATGIFDDATDAAVKAFQLKFQTEVLTPWFLAGLVPHSNPTGWMYQLTRWKINNIVCPGSEAMPVLIP